MYGQLALLKFTKKGAEIIEKAEARRQALSARIQSRQLRIEKVCAEAHLTAADFWANVDEFAANRTGLLTVGTQAELAAEAGKIKGEREEMSRLAIIVRNLDPEALHQLSFDDLTYLEF